MESRYFLCLLLSLALLGCHPRQELGGGKMINDNADLTFAGRVDVFNDMSTRSYPTDPAEIKAHRITFKGLRVVLYSVSPSNKELPQEVAYAFDFDINADKGTFNGKDYEIINNGDAFSFKTNKSIKVAPNDYIIYFFTTPGVSLKEATKVGQPFSALKEPMAYGKEDFQYDKLLGNHYYSATPTKISKSLFSDNTPGKTYEIPISNLTALNAMLSVKWQPVIKDSDYELLKDLLIFYPDVQNKKYLLFPENDTELETALGLKYPKDANYSGFSGKSLTELSSDFLYTSDVEMPYFTSSSNSTDKINVYRMIPENTMSGNEKGIAVITRVIMYISIIPKALKEHLSAQKLSSTCLSWVSWNGSYYEGSEFLSKYNALKSKSNRTNEEEKLITEGNKIIKDGELIKEGYEDDNIKYYHCGNSYYAIPITHYTKDALGEKSSNTGYYGVVRNHHYQLDIRSFATIGRANYKYLPITGEYVDNVKLTPGININDMKDIVNVIDVLE